MATMVSEIYDAFIEAGASQDKARKAAEAVAGYETRVADSDARSHKFERDIISEVSELRREFIALRGEVNLLKWMVGFNTAATIAVLIRLLFP